MYSNEVVYVTSFSKHIFETSGKELLYSHTLNKVPNPIYAYSEDSIPAIRQLNQKLLAEFLHQFADYIPHYFGGRTQACQCPFSDTKQKHKEKCYWTLWNRNAFRWYHKVATLIQVLNDIPPETKYLVWVDSDCRFIGQVTSQTIANIICGFDAAYLQGASREAAETGFIIFNLKTTGRDIIQEWNNRFWSRRFLNDNRWDDGYQFTRLVQTHGGTFRFRDMVEGLRGCKKVIVGRCPLINNFVTHNKGIHARSGLFK